MKLSVIIPAFNEEKYIERCVVSIARALEVHAARLADMEIIVTDNNSTDATAEVARRAGAEVVFEPVNHISRARNAGARVATGDWLLFIDADCELHADTLADMLDHVDRGGCAGGGCDVVIDRAPALGRLIVFGARKFMKLTKNAGGAFLFCRADAFRDVGGFNEEVYAAEEIFMSKALKRWAAPRGLQFVFLTRKPLLVSGRKFYLYGYRDFLRIFLYGLVSPKRTLGSKDRLGYFYDGRR